MWQIPRWWGVTADDRTQSNTFVPLATVYGCTQLCISWYFLSSKQFSIKKISKQQQPIIFCKFLQFNHNKNKENNNKQQREIVVYRISYFSSYSSNPGYSLVKSWQIFSTIYIITKSYLYDIEDLVWDSYYKTSL